MGKKYIIELEEMIVSTADGQMPLYKIKGLNTPIFDSASINKLTPYSEPDLSAVRNEAYKEAYNKGYQDAVMKISSNEHTIAEKAYQGGRIDAWDAARKIACDRAHGGFCIDTKQHIFGAANYAYILANYTASEAIEKIRQYEQKKKQKEKIKAGDVVRHKKHPEIKIWVVYVDDCDNQMITGVAIESVNGCCKVGEAYINRDAKDWEKTGEHYNVAEYLRKMREEK